jgi:hypothetical protein
MGGRGARRARLKNASTPLPAVTPPAVAALRAGQATRSCAAIATRRYLHLQRPEFQCQRWETDKEGTRSRPPRREVSPPGPLHPWHPPFKESPGGETTLYTAAEARQTTPRKSAVSQGGGGRTTDPGAPPVRVQHFLITRPGTPHAVRPSRQPRSGRAQARGAPGRLDFRPQTGRQGVASRKRGAAAKNAATPRTA